MRLEIEIAAAVRNDMIFVLVGLDRDAVGRLLEQVDRRRRVEREHARLHRGGQPGVDLVEGKQQVDSLCLEPRHHGRKAGHMKCQELARKHEVLAQEIEAAENPVVVWEAAHPSSSKPSCDRQFCGAGTMTGSPNSSRKRKYTPTQSAKSCS